MRIEKYNIFEIGELPNYKYPKIYFENFNENTCDTIVFVLCSE